MRIRRRRSSWPFPANGDDGAIPQADPAWIERERLAIQTLLDDMAPSRDDRSGASYMDKKRAQVADKAVVTSNMPVVQGGIVTLRPTDGKDDSTMTEAGRFLAEDPHNEELARTAVWAR